MPKKGGYGGFPKKNDKHKIHNSSLRNKMARGIKKSGRHKFNVRKRKNDRHKIHKSSLRNRNRNRNKIAGGIKKPHRFKCGVMEREKDKRKQEKIVEAGGNPHSPPPFLSNFF